MHPIDAPPCYLRPWFICSNKNKGERFVESYKFSRYAARSPAFSKSKTNVHDIVMGTITCTFH